MTGGRQIAAIVAAGLLAAGAAWLAYDGDAYVTILTREIRQAGWGETARVISVLRWPVVAVVAVLALTVLSPLVDRLLKGLRG